MKKMVINKIIIFKVIVFICLLIVIWNIIFQILWIDKSAIYDFYQEEKNTADIVYIGSSSVYSSFNTLKAYKEYGIISAVLASDVQPLGATKFMLEEAQKYQDPDIYVLDINLYFQPVDEIAYVNIRKATDALKFSQTRKNAVDYLLKYTNVDKVEYISYYFSFLTYHSSWKDISLYKFESRMIKGHYLNELTVSISPQEEYIWNDNYFELPVENYEMIEDLVDYIRENELNVLFVSAPKIFNDEEIAKLNTVIRILKTEGFDVINTNDNNILNLDYQNDFYNSSHINVYGADKFTTFLCNYLQTKYNVGELSIYNKSWEDAYNDYISRLENLLK